MLETIYTSGCSDEIFCLRKHARVNKISPLLLAHPSRKMKFHLKIQTSTIPALAAEMTETEISQRGRCRTVPIQKCAVSLDKRHNPLFLTCVYNRGRRIF